MRRPAVILAAAVLSGILYRLPGIPVVYRFAAIVFDLAAGSYTVLRSRGKSRMPLLFLFLLFSLGFVLSFLRTDFSVRKYEQPEVSAFFKKYEATNPGEFDYSVYLKSLDVTDEAERKALKTRNRELESPLRQILGDFKEAASEILDTWFSTEDSGVIKAVLLGEKNGMEQEIKELYQSSGISHLLAVSGLHVSMIGSGVLFMTGKLELGKYPGAFLSALLVFLYAFFTGGTASSLRAAIMFGLGSAALIRGRKKDMASFLAIAMALLLLKNPYLLLQSGFQLSFGAIAGILLSGVIFNEKNRGGTEEERNIKKKADALTAVLPLNRIQRRITKALQVSLCVSMTEMPLVAFSFFSLPLYSIFLNLAVIPLLTALFLSGTLVLLTGGLYSVLSMLQISSAPFAVFPLIAGSIAHYILKFYAVLSEFTLKLPGAGVLLGRPSHPAILIYYGFLLVVLFFVKMIRNRKLKLPVIFGLYLISFPMLMYREKKDTYVTVLDVGQGDCFHIHSGETDILIDCGSSGLEWAGSGIAEDYLLSRRISDVDLMIASHADSDHTNGLIYLLSEESAIKTKQLVLPALARKDDKYEKLKNAGRETDIGFAEKGTAFRDGDLELICIYAETDPGAVSDTNRESTVWLLKYGSFSMLFTGDITEKEEYAIVSLYEEYFQKQRLTVLKCAHHGSDTANSDLFLKKLRPELAVLSYGEGNRYGHPSETVIERLKSNRIRYISTADNGSICFEISENSMVWHQWKEE